MHDDEPGDEVHDLFAEAVYGDHPLGRLISGTEETISPMTRRQILALLPRAATRAPPIVVAAAGNLDHAAVVRWSRRRCAAPPLDARSRPRRRAAPATPAPRVRTGGGHGGASQGHRAGARRARRRRASAGSTSAGSRSACSTTCSAAACPAGCSRRSASSAGWRTRSTRTPRQYADSGLFGGLRRLRARQGRRGARPDPRRAGHGRRRRRHRRRAGPGQGHGSRASYVLGLEDTGSRMSRLGEGRAALRRPPVGRRAARPGRRGHRSTT